MRACTVIAGNYLSRARVLACSFGAHHPDGELTALVVDTTHRRDEDGLRFVSPDDLSLERDAFEQMAVMYNVTELCTALKPWMLETVVGEGDAPVTYLDPDIEVAASLESVDRLVGRDGIVVVPHLVNPLPRDGKFPDDEIFLTRGQYNLGFITVGPRAHAFLAWWQDRLRWHCLDAPEDGYFVDQKWMDSGARMFPSVVLEDPGFDVAYWNLHERALERRSDGLFVGEHPLRFMHYSGFDPTQPDQLSHWQSGVTRFDLNGDAVVVDLLDRYRRHLEKHSRDDDPEAYGFEAVGEVVLTPELRRTYRTELLDGQAPTAPLSHPSEFQRWAADVHRRQDRARRPLTRLIGIVNRRRG